MEAGHELSGLQLLGVGIPKSCHAGHASMMKAARELLRRAEFFISESLGEGTTPVVVPTDAESPTLVKVEGREVVLERGGRVISPRQVGPLKVKAMAGEGNVFDVYEQCYAERRGALERELEAKTAEFAALFDSYGGLKSAMAKERAADRIAAVEADIEDIKAKLEPLGSLREAWLEEAAAWQAKVADARNAIMGSDDRKRAEQTRKVIGKIIVDFDYRRHGKQWRSMWKTITIEAVDGGTATFSNANRPAPD